MSNKKNGKTRAEHKQVEIAGLSAAPPNVSVVPVSAPAVLPMVPPPVITPITNPQNQQQLGIRVEVPLSELQKRKLYLATPMYGGQCSGMYTKSVCDLVAAAKENKIELSFYFLFNESLITRARNYCVDEFTRSPCTHLLFIDSDIGFNPQDVFLMLALMGDDSPYDVLAAPYPKKCISWEKIRVAVEKGFAHPDPNQLDRYVGDFVFNPKSGTGSIPLGAPAEVLEAGTGFMMIRKQTFERFKAGYPDLKYRPDHVRTAAFDGSREIGMYFQADVCPTSKRYLSEDYWFCQKVQQLGMKVFLCPWMKTSHIGTFVFSGSLLDIAQLGVSPTADPQEMQRIKEAQFAAGQRPVGL
jgi:hypothetical protein